MRIEHLTPAHVRRAVHLYMALAWPDPDKCNPWFDPDLLEGVGTTEELFALFSSANDRKDSPHCARYTLRLGNDEYPFMKFVLQEYLIDHEYFFSVDTHDDLDVPPESPDYPAWIDLRNRNRQLKHRIEADWTAAGLPTNEELREIAEGLARVETVAHRRERLLVVDDERGVARGLEALLTAQGYLVEVAYDGQQVLERLDLDPLPDLVLLDYSMPELDGEEVLGRMRSSDRLRDLPVLLVTASSIDMARLQRVSGLLRKPYPRKVLFKMLDQLLQHDAPSG